MKKLRTAVVGVGYLGRFHAQKYASLPQVELVGVADSDPERGRAVAAEIGTTAFDDYRQLVGKVDAVSVVVPTSFHHEVGAFFLKNGIHLLMEKPITTTIEEADDLIRLAKENSLVLQVGHLERFNPALQAAEARIVGPGFIDAARVAPYKPRATDVSVVLDLMVHDIDIICTIFNSPVKSVSASGALVYSPTPDIANARIEFESGAVANVTASRISLQGDRSIKLFQQDACISVDFQNRKATVYSKGDSLLPDGTPEVKVEELAVPQQDQILAEITAFVESIMNGQPVKVSGEDGRRALEIALLVEKRIEENLALLKAGA
ncbi:MAG: Gfo/Idh/MocA family oxidoreductase [Geobacter sp.]|nr:Gfo/Idh/MocA family oxidoreductase [Geobacter sp.]